MYVYLAQKKNKQDNKSNKTENGESQIEIKQKI